MSYIFKFFTLLCLFFLQVFDIFSQNSLPRQKFKFDIISIEEGLSQSTVLATFQDHYGFMWIGTRDGLNKYNGYSFEIFKNKVNDSTSICGNIINDITEDNSGTLWIATDKGLSRYNRDTNHFTNYVLPSDLNKTGEIQVLKVDKNNQLWIATKQGLFLFQQDEGEFTHISSLFPHLGLESKASIHSLHIQHDSLLWIGTTYRGLYAINIDNIRSRKQASFYIADSIFGNAWIESIQSAPDNKLWVATYGNGLFLIDQQGNIEKNFSTYTTNGQALTNNNIRSLAYDNDGNLWIGTFEGLNVLTSGQDKIIQIRYEKGDQNGLSHGSVRSITKDNKGSLWIGTYFGGISIFDKDNQRFSHFYHIPGDPTSLNYNIIGALSEDKQGNILIGTERGGVNIYNQKSHSHSVFENYQEGIVNQVTVKSIFTDQDENIWVGTFKKGLHLINAKTGKIEEFPAPEDKAFSYLKESIINCIVQDEGGSLWLGLDGLGAIVQFNPKTKRFSKTQVSDKLNDIVKNAFVKNITLTGKNEFWISTRGSGLIYYHPEKNIVQQKTNLLLNDKPIDIKEINFLHKGGNEIWIATHGNGVVKANATTFKFEAHYFDVNGLLNNTVYGILEDPDQHLWFLTLSGISHLQNKNDSETFKNYTFSSGFPIQEMNEGAFYKTNNGDFLIGGNNGYVRFNPLTLSDNQLIPSVVITDLKIANKSVVPGDNHNVLQNALQDTKEITLSYFQSVITAEFAALSYLRPENNQYAYKLQGFSEDWNYIKNNRAATFTNLEEGTYQFQVKGSNNDGVWNEEATILTINVLPPPWKTWWAFLGYSIILILGFLMIRQNAIKGAKMKMNLKLEQLEKEKWKEIHQLKLKYFTDVSHEFRTPLTLITNPLEEILESEKGGKWIRKRLKTMHYNSRRMLLLIDQILEIRELETGHSKLKLSAVNLHNHLGNVVDSFKALADKKRIRLRYTSQLIQELHMVDTDKLEKIFYNLLSNAFKFTPEGGIISVEFERFKQIEQDWFRFLVSDTGIGIEKENIFKIFDRFYTNSSEGSGAGIGLSLTKSLVELQKGSIRVKSARLKGSTFIIELPFSKAQNKIDLPAGNKNFTKPIPLEYSPTHNGFTTKEENLEADAQEDTILIVEDIAELRNYLKEQLSKKYKILLAANGLEALEKLRKKGASLILSDIMMPEMDGFELCKQVKSEPELCHIPIILLTAKSSHINRLEGLEHGADDYISKPFIMREVKFRIKNILSNRKLLQKKFKESSLITDISTIKINSYDEKLLKKLIEIVEKNIDEPTLTVEFLSKEVALSRVHLFRKLKSITGMTPTDFIKDYRMKRATQLLATQKLSISEVAYEVGFQDVHYFGKCFKKAYGTSPSEYAKSLTETEKA